MEQDSIIDNAITNVRGNAAGICASQPLKAGCASSTKGLAPPALCQDSHTNMPPNVLPPISRHAPHTRPHELPPHSLLALSSLSPRYLLATPSQQPCRQCRALGSSSATDAQAAAAGGLSGGGATPTTSPSDILDNTLLSPYCYNQVQHPALEYHKTDILDDLPVL